MGIERPIQISSSMSIMPTQFTVLNGDGVAFSVPLIVLNGDGTPFIIPKIVLNGDGIEFNVI